jgi:hypothetical protein
VFFILLCRLSSDLSPRETMLPLVIRLLRKVY